MIILIILTSLQIFIGASEVKPPSAGCMVQKWKFWYMSLIAWYIASIPYIMVGTSDHLACTCTVGAW